MLRSLIFAAVLGLVGPTLLMPAPAVAVALPEFTTEAAAAAHCPSDVVVWLNTSPKSHIYHYKGQRWYHHTIHGAFVCEKEAIAAGMRATLNGE